MDLVRRRARGERLLERRRDGSDEILQRAERPGNQEIVARANSRTNPPEVEAKRLQSSAKLQAELARLKAEKERRDKSHAGNPG